MPANCHVWPLTRRSIDTHPYRYIDVESLVMILEVCARLESWEKSAIELRSEAIKIYTHLVMKFLA